MDELQGKVAFVTGGSSGIGLGIAQAFADAGMSLAIGYRSPRHLDEAMRVLDRFADRVHPVELDVSDRASVEAAGIDIIKRFGKVHILVANAGVGVLKEVAQASYEDWDWQIAINLTGVFNTLHVFLPLIREHGEGGHIVGTSSVMGLVTAPGHALYSASKYGLLGLLEGLRLDLFDTDIGVSIYCPGNVYANLEIRTTAPTDRRRADTTTEARREAQRQEFGDIAMDPLEAGQLVLEGIRHNDLYILTHPEFDWMIKQRHEAIEAANPAHLQVPAERDANVRDTYYNPIYAHETGPS